jgi:hypothetical protein
VPDCVRTAVEECEWSDVQCSGSETCGPTFADSGALAFERVDSDVDPADSIVQCSDESEDDARGSQTDKSGGEGGEDAVT